MVSELRFVEDGTDWSRDYDGLLVPAWIGASQVTVLLTRAALASLIGLDSSEVSAGTARTLFGRFESRLAGIVLREYARHPRTPIRIDYGQVDHRS